MEVVRLSPLKTQGCKDKNYMRPTVTFSSYVKQAGKESLQCGIVVMMADV